MRTNTACLFRRLIGLCVLLTVPGAAIYAQDAPRNSPNPRAKALPPKVQPEYPSIAKQLKIEGAVELETVVGESAAVEKVNIVSGKSVLQELQAVVPSNPSVPVQSRLLDSQREPGVFDFLRAFPWVLEPFLCEDQDRLLAALSDKVIGPAEAKAKQQTGR